MIRRASGLLLGCTGFAIVALAADGPPTLPKDTLPDSLDIATIPLGLEKKRPIPTENPLTKERAELGRRLFFDPILSADRSVACASCHLPDRGFAGKESRAVGIRGQVGRRNAPTLLNRAYGTSMFWDGRVATLEEQALKPIEDPLEMGFSVPEAIKRLKDHQEYRKRFEGAFSDGVTASNLAKAIAGFERTVLSGNNKADLFVLGEVGGMNERERHGMWIFQSRGLCWRCHSGHNLTDEDFHNTGVSWGKEPLDLGRFEVTKNENDRGRFKTPTLRGIGETAPYMHDGSIATLEEVVEFYNRGGVKNPHLDPVMQPLELKKDEMGDLVAFLRTLSTGRTPDRPPQLKK